MADRLKSAAPQAAAPHMDPDEIAQSGLIPQLGMMYGALMQSPVRNVLFALGGALVAVVIATAVGQIRLNRWNQPFYDALSRYDLRGFVVQLGVFGAIAGVLLVLNVGQRWLTETLKLKLREGLGRDLIENWLKPMRAFRLASAGAIGVNPDQRMHEDARHLTELSADLGTGLLQAGTLMAVFIGVLWQISSRFAFHVHGQTYQVPGYLVWAAVIYAVSASLLSYQVGKGLIARNGERYAREADMRFALVRVNEHIDSIALAKGEADEARRVKVDFAAVLAATRSLVIGLTNLTWVTAGYGWFTLVAPILAAAPLYFSHDLSFGGLMMAAGAFTQVQTSLRWFVDNFSQIADWRATLLRVASFRRALLNTDDIRSVDSIIAVREGEPGVLRIEKLEIASPSGAVSLQEQHVEIKKGARVLITGEAGTGKTLLFRALAGLWPWGSGSITWPKDEDVLYVPQRPYWPPGTLREGLAYPRDVRQFKVADFKHALERVKLERLCGQLDRSDHYHRELSEEDLERLAFARVLLHAPPWILIDEVLDYADADTQALIVDLLARDLKDSAVIHIGRTRAHDKTFKQTLHLLGDPKVRRLPRKGMHATKRAGGGRERNAQ